MEFMNIILLDLFSGIGGFHKGLEDAGFVIEKSYYSEIDKHAIAIYKNKIKNAEYVGDITALEGRTLQRPNIITFGSPCQDFSVAGRRHGLEGQRSSLIGEAIRIVAECKPDIFIWENVKGIFSSNDGADFWAVIQAFIDIRCYRLEWQLLNTAWFLPQNRERIYLIGHLATDRRSEKGIFPITETFGMSDKSQKETRRNGKGVRDDNSRCIARTIQQRSAIDGSENLIKVANTLSERYYKDGAENLIGDFRLDEGIRIRKDNICPNINARERTDGCGQPIIVAQRGRENGQQLELQKEDKTNTLTGIQKDNMIIVSELTEYQGDKITQEDRGIMPTIPANGGNNLRGIGLQDRNMNVRRLTEIECERLQGFPDNWTEYGNYDGTIKKVPKTQRYKCLGNAVTVKVVEEIGKRLIQIL